MTRTTRPAGPLSPEYRTVTATLVTLVTIVAFESLAVSTVMPEAAADLAARTRYGLAFSSMLTAQLLGIVLAGPWIGRSGPLTPTWAGQGLFATGSLVAGLAPTFEILIAGRVVAGLGAGLIIVAMYVTVGSAFPARMRPQVFAWMSAAWVLPAVVGPLLAAALAATSSWRAVFLVVVPAVALTSAGLLVVRRRLGERPDARDEGQADASTASDAEAEPAPMAYPSTRATVWLALLVAAGAGAFQWAGTDLVPPRPLMVGLAVGGLLVLAAAARPLLPPGTFRLRRGLPAVIAARFCFSGAFTASVTYVPLMLVSTRGMNAGLAGAILALSSVGWSLGSYLQGRSSFDPRSRPVVAAGGVCVVAGLTGFVLIALTGAPAALVALAGTVLGVGMGLGSTGVSVLVLHLAPRSQHAQASSAMSLADTLGATVGLAVAGTLYASTSTSGPNPTAFAVLWAGCGVFGLAALLAGCRVRARSQRART